MKHKKHKREKKNKGSKKSKKYSSSSESSVEEEWVEKGSTECSRQQNPPVVKAERDEWMSDKNIFSGLTRDDLRKKKEDDDVKQETNFIDLPGQSSRELNPYWKDGGKGLPETARDSVTLISSGVGDRGVTWLRKSLQRTKEQAEEEGRSMEEVAAERWGSLDKLQSLLREAEEREFGHRTKRSDSDNNKRRRDQDRYFDKESSSKRNDDRYRRDDYRRREYSPKHRKTEVDERNWSSRRSDENRRHNDEKRDDGKTSKKSMFLKPEDDSFKSPRNTREEPKRDHQAVSSRSGGWRKNKSNEERSSSLDKPRESDSKPQESEAPKEAAPKEVAPKEVAPKEVEILSEDDMNALGARIIKAEIMGNVSLAAELKRKLESARAAKDKVNKEGKEVILTTTNSRGMTRPVSGSIEGQHGRKHKAKVGTHESGKRVRYFADDDKYSLQDIFVQEKMQTGSDHDELFAKLARKKIGVDESARDMDDVFEETARVDEGADSLERRMRQKAINEFRKKEKVLDSCMWCLESKILPSEAVIAIGNQVFVCVPPYQSLTEGHCMIVTNQHLSCGTAVDEDVWEEIMDLRKSLVKLYASEEDDVIFFESALNLNKYPHMTIHCVPVPKEIGDMAPIYFKKAILECEMEWSTNKKLVDLAGKGIRKAVPKGMSYFAVDFGMQDGFAHVIEDRKLFPNNFAQEIIGGMMDLDHTIWRKNKRDTPEEVIRKSSNFKEIFQKFSPYQTK